jgi:hypothetical protein
MDRGGRVHYRAVELCNSTVRGADEIPFFQARGRVSTLDRAQVGSIICWLTLRAVVGAAEFKVARQMGIEVGPSENLRRRDIQGYTLKV